MSKRILLIDDDRLVVKSLQMLLSQAGYAVDPAESGKEALNLIKENIFDLIISDIKMPDTNGVETAKLIEEHYKKIGKSVPIIFITGYPGEKITDEAQKLNPADFIYKPFDKEEFLNAIAIAIKK